MSKLLYDYQYLYLVIPSEVMACPTHKQNELSITDIVYHTIFIIN